MTRIGVVAAALLAAAVTVSVTPASAAPPDAYRPLIPTRILDTRAGLGAPQAPVGPDAAIDVVVTGTAGVPATGVAAVVLNLTGTGASQATFIAAYPTGTERNGSNLNLLAGQTDSNLVIASVGSGGKVSLYNRFGTVDLVADVAGWFPAGDAYRPLAPARILDTRTGGTTVGADSVLDLQVTGAGGVPASGVGAVVLNVTGTNPSANTFVAAYPSGGTRDGSNLNLVAGQTDSSSVIATVGAGGRVALYNRFGSVDLVVDVAGWFPVGSNYSPLPPTRVLDTRDGTGAPGAKVGEDGHIDVQVTGVAGVPASGVGAVVVNVTATDPTANTFVSVYPSGNRREGSNINLRPGQTTSNLVVAAVGADGKIALYNRFGATHLVADVTGWLPGEPQTGPGVLWATGIGRIWRLPLGVPAAEWEQRGVYDEAATVDLPRNRWIEADTDPFDPLIFRVRDLDTNVVTESFEVDSAAWSVDDISVSPDGRYLAMIAATSSLETWIEIVDLNTRTSKEFGWVGVAREVEFAPNGELLVLFDDTYEEAYEWASAIGVITAAQLAAGDAPTVGMVQTFSDADGRPGCVRAGPNVQLSYGLNGGVHVREAAGSPHQLSTNGRGESQSCAVFAPNGQRIAFVQHSVAAGFQRQYVIPNHRGAPIYFDWLDDSGDEYLLAVDNTISEIIAWQP